MGLTLRDVTAAFANVEKDSAKKGLAVNENRTKLLVSTNRESARLGKSVNASNFNFEVVDEFVYLGIAINKTNDIS